MPPSNCLERLLKKRWNWTLALCLVAVTVTILGTLPSSVTFAGAFPQQAQLQTSTTSPSPPHAVTHAPHHKRAAHKTAETANSPQNLQLSNNHYHINSDGRRVHSPAKAASVPPGAIAVCRDGSYSFSQHHRGTCSYHGGVSRWL